MGLVLCYLSFFYDQIRSEKSQLLGGAELSADSSTGHTEMPGEKEGTEGWERTNPRSTDVLYKLFFHPTSGQSADAYVF